MTIGTLGGNRAGKEAQERRVSARGMGGWEGHISTVKTLR